MRRVSLAIVVAALPLAWGCGFGERMNPVGGRVTVADGSPLPGIRVVFTAQGRSLSATGRTDADGRYVLGTTKPGGGVPAGDYTVVAVDDDRGLDIDHPTPSRIALRYADPATSGFTASIDATHTTFDLVLDEK